MNEAWQAPDRRSILAAVVGLALVPMRAFATPAQVETEMGKLYAGKPMAEGKIMLDLPPIAENGLVVPLNFEVESPMTAENYVKSLTFFSQGNPNPVVASYHFSPLMPKAAGQMRIRLAGTQYVVAVAEMSDGTLYQSRKEVKVTIGGCGG